MTVKQCIKKNGPEITEEDINKLLEKIEKITKYRIRII